MSYDAITFNNPRWFLGEKQYLDFISYFIMVSYCRRISKSIVFKMTICIDIGMFFSVCNFVHISVSLNPILNYMVTFVVYD